MKVKILITEILQRVVIMDVQYGETALDMVKDDYKAEKIVLDADDFEDVDFEIIR